MKKQTTIGKKTEALRARARSWRAADDRELLSEGHAASSSNKGDLLHEALCSQIPSNTRTHRHRDTNTRAHRHTHV